MIFMTRSVLTALSVGVSVLSANAVLGQDYPNRLIRIIAAPAGSGADVDARIIAPGISASLGQPVIVDNRTAILASDSVAKAPPDGYTLLINGSSTWITPLLQKAPYDGVTDLSPISMVERAVYIFAVHPSVPVKSVKGLIALAKSRPGELNYGVGSIGGGSHLGMELFIHTAGVKIVRIVYKGPALAVTALVSGEVQLSNADVGAVVPLAKLGKLRALAVTSAEPSLLVPDLPTVAGSGLPGYEAVQMMGTFAPAKTPAAIINRLNQDIVRFLSRTEVKQRFLALGEEVVANSPAEFAAIVRSDVAKIGKLIKDADIKIN